LLFWRIASLTPPEATFHSFFNNVVAPNIQEDGKDIVTTYVGRGKDCLDIVDSDLGVSDVVKLFGPFVKYLVENMDQATSTSGTCNFFT
jgi:hypothetical protein